MGFAHLAATMITCASQSSVTDPRWSCRPWWTPGGDALQHAVEIGLWIEVIELGGGD
jgi:hypothetical protein